MRWEHIETHVVHTTGTFEEYMTTHIVAARIHEKKTPSAWVDLYCENKGHDGKGLLKRDRTILISANWLRASDYQDEEVLVRHLVELIQKGILKETRFVTM